MGFRKVLSGIEKFKSKKSEQRAACARQGATQLHDDAFVVDPRQERITEFLFGGDPTLALGFPRRPQPTLFEGNTQTRPWLTDAPRVSQKYPTFRKVPHIFCVDTSSSMSIWTSGSSGKF